MRRAVNLAMDLTICLGGCESLFFGPLSRWPAPCGERTLGPMDPSSSSAQRVLEALKTAPQSSGSPQEILSQWLLSIERLGLQASDEVLFFDAFLQTLDAAKPADRSAFITRVHADDLYLARACASNQAAAMALFDQRYRRQLLAIAGRFESSHFSAEDLLQSLYEKLLVSRPSRPAKLWSYTGQGPLESWLKVSAVRAFVDSSRTGAQRKLESAVDDETMARFFAPDEDPEIRYLKTKYRADFKVALQQALGTLSSAQRNLLRHQLIAGLSIDQVGAIYGIHRATAARRLSRAREALLKATRQQLTARLDASEEELSSIIGLINSRFEASLHRLLAEKTDAPTSS